MRVRWDTFYTNIYDLYLFIYYIGLFDFLYGILPFQCFFFYRVYMLVL